MSNQGLQTECLAIRVSSHHHKLEVRTNNVLILIMYFYYFNVTFSVSIIETEKNNQQNCLVNVKFICMQS